MDPPLLLLPPEGAGRAGFVLANSVGDASHSKRGIRRRLIESKSVDVVVAIGGNFFYTVTPPVTLWLPDRGKTGTGRAGSVLFIDARHLYRQIDHMHHDFLPEQIELIANIVRLYLGEDVETVDGRDSLLEERVPNGSYADVADFASSRPSRISKVKAGASTQVGTQGPRLPTRAHRLREPRC